MRDEYFETDAANTGELRLKYAKSSKISAKTS